MLYVFHGTNVSQSARKARALLDSLRRKKPDAAHEIMNADNWNESVLEGHLGGQGLFSSKYIVFLDRLLENAEAKEKLIDFIPSLKDSANIFIVLEGKLLAEYRKSFDKNAEKVIVSDQVAESRFAKGKDFNIFALADAFGARDSLKAWAIYRRAVDMGHESEGIIGTLFWQVKSMILSKSCSSAAEAGLSPFVYSKSRKYAGNFTDQEMSCLSNELVLLYHDGHRGLVDLEIATERLMLNIVNRA